MNVADGKGALFVALSGLVKILTPAIQIGINIPKDAESGEICSKNLTCLGASNLNNKSFRPAGCDGELLMPPKLKPGLGGFG